MTVSPSAGPALRALRSLVLGGVAVITGVLAHASSGGFLPGAGAVVMLWLGASAAVAPLLGRQASTSRVVVLLVLGQTAIHGALTGLVGHRGDPAFQGHAASVRPVYPVHEAGARRSGSFFDQVAPVHAGGNGNVPLPSWMQHLAADMTGPHALMALGHLAAAAVVGLWLAAGERALWTLLTVTSRPLLDGLVLLFAAGAASGATASESLTTRLRRVGLFTWPERAHACTALLPHSVVRRGPPVLAVS